MNNINNLSNINFKNLSVGALPASYMESLSYEEQLIYLANYLENQVIPSVNNVISLVNSLNNYTTELDAKFNELENNLTNTIYNKLDDTKNEIMTEINPRFESIQNDITNLTDELNTQYDEIQKVKTDKEPICLSLLNNANNTYHEIITNLNLNKKIENHTFNPTIELSNKLTIDEITEIITEIQNKITNGIYINGTSHVNVLTVTKIILELNIYANGGIIHNSINQFINELSSIFTNATIYILPISVMPEQFEDLKYEITSFNNIRKAINEMTNEIPCILFYDDIIKSAMANGENQIANCFTKFILANKDSSLELTSKDNSYKIGTNNNYYCLYIGYINKQLTFNITTNFKNILNAALTDAYNRSSNKNFYNVITQNTGFSIYNSAPIMQFLNESYTPHVQEATVPIKTNDQHFMTKFYFEISTSYCALQGINLSSNSQTSVTLNSIPSTYDVYAGRYELEKSFNI